MVRHGGSSSSQSVTVSLTPNNGNYLEDLGNGTIKVNVKNLPGSKEDGVFFRVVQESWERITQNPTQVDPQEVSLDGLLTMEVSSSDNYTCETEYAPGVLDGSECVDTKELEYETRPYTYPTTPYTYTTRTVSVYGHYDWNFSWGHCTGEGKSGNWPNGDPYCQTPVVGWHDVTETVKNSTPNGYVDNGSVWVSESPSAAPSSGASIDPYFTDSGYVDNGSMYAAKSPKPASIHNNAGLGISYNYEPSVNKYQARTNADTYSTYRPVFNSLPSTVLSWEANGTEYTTLEGNDTGRDSATIKIYTLTGVKYLTGTTDSTPQRP